MLPIKTDDIKDIVKYVLIAVAVAIALRFIIKNAKKVSNLLKSKQEAKEEEEEAKNLGYSTKPRFDETYHKQIAEQLDDGFNPFPFGLGTNEDYVYSGYAQIASGTAGDMIGVKAQYLVLTGSDLFKDTREELNKEELSFVREILTNMPKHLRP